MIDIDETDLIEFFGVLPGPEPAEERELFDAPTFRKEIDGLVLEVSISRHFDDLRLGLSRMDMADDAPLLECVLESVTEVRFERDRTGMLWLRARTEHVQVEIAVEPTISIRHRTLREDDRQ